MSGEAWRVRLTCTRAEAEALPFADDAFADIEPPPTLLTDEPDPAAPDDWLLDAFFAEQPGPELIARLHTMAPSARGRAEIERLPDEDWVTLSQAGLAPVRAGRFVVHTRAHRTARRPGDHGIEIEAGLAFGTGQHFTTHGCLAALDRLRRRHRFRNALDLGTGTGVLALAIVRGWPTARVIASDIDAVATRVAAANVRANGVRVGRTVGAIELVTAIGMANPRLHARRPYDLITANILAAPLVAMAGPVSAALAPGGTLILAGLLTSQARRVEAAYTARGLKLVARHDFGEWPTLVLRRGATRARRGTAAFPRATLSSWA